MTIKASALAEAHVSALKAAASQIVRTQHPHVEVQLYAFDPSIGKDGVRRISKVGHGTFRRRAVAHLVQARMSVC